MELHDIVENVKTKEELIQFIHHLRKDLLANEEEWENVSLADYLDAMAAWMEDMDGYYKNTGQPIPEQASWKTLADILFAATMYE